MPLYYCPAVVYGGTTFWLPPGVTVRSRRQQANEKIPIPNTDTMVIGSIRKNQGTQIDLTMEGVLSARTQARVLQMFEDIWEACSGRQFKLFVFSDRAWRDCVLESQEDRIGLDPMTVFRDGALSIFCPHSKPDTSLQLSFSDFNAEYPYAAQVGRPSGDAVTPGGGLSPVTEPARQVHNGKFPGVLDAITTVGREHRIVVGGTTGSTWRIKALQIVSAELVGSGTTQVTVSTQPVGGGGSTINATIGAAAYYGAQATGNIEVAAGSTVYVYVSTAGEHQNVQYQLQLEAD